MPPALALQLLDDIQPEMIDRLAELQIFSAFDLATRNPVLIWLRMPNELSQVVAWIAQAQLLVLVREAGLKTARAQLIRDIFDLVDRLRDEDAAVPAIGALGLPKAAGKTLLRSIEATDTYRNLLQLRAALTTCDRAGPGEERSRL